MGDGVDSDVGEVSRNIQQDIHSRIYISTSPQ
jgi:hypothetical protein